MTCPYCLGTGWEVRPMWSHRLGEDLDVRTACHACHGTGET